METIWLTSLDTSLTCLGSSLPSRFCGEGTIHFFMFLSVHLAQGNHFHSGRLAFSCCHDSTAEEDKHTSSDFWFCSSGYNWNSELCGHEPKHWQGVGCLAPKFPQRSFYDFHWFYNTSISCILYHHSESFLFLVRFDHTFKIMPSCAWWVLECLGGANVSRGDIWHWAHETESAGGVLYHWVKSNVGTT